jgi:hypothetical protein
MDEDRSSIHTQGGASVSGSAHTESGDFVGRDQNIQGDVVHRDKIITSPTQAKELEELREAQVRRVEQAAHAHEAEARQRRFLTE